MGKEEVYEEQESKGPGDCAERSIDSGLHSSCGGGPDGWPSGEFGSSDFHADRRSCIGKQSVSDGKQEISVKETSEEKGAKKEEAGGQEQQTVSDTEKVPVSAA